MTTVFILSDHEWSEDAWSDVETTLGVYDSFEAATQAAPCPIYSDGDEPEDNSSYCTIIEWSVGSAVEKSKAIFNPDRLSPDGIARRKVAALKAEIETIQKERNAREEAKRQNVARVTAQEVVADPAFIQHLSEKAAAIVARRAKVQEAKALEKP